MSIDARYLAEHNLTELLAEGRDGEITADVADLVRLHRHVSEQKPSIVLEFGSGFSTVFMAHACSRYWTRSQARVDSVASPPMPKVVAVESSEEWAANTMRKVELAGLTAYVEVHVSAVEIGTYAGQLCHFFENLPDVVPDFIYLDGPDPATVRGNVRGLTFREPRTVTAADVLLYESTLTPGSSMIVDGRTNNARFLARHFVRDWTITWDQAADYTLFVLDEPRLGYKNISGTERYPG